MAKTPGVLGKLLQLARPPATGGDCCGVEIVEDTDDAPADPAEGGGHAGRG